MNEASHKHVVKAFSILKCAYAAIAIVSGIDKYFGLIADWTRFISPLISRNVAIAPTTILYIVGAIEIVVGLLILSKHTKLGAYIISAWLVIAAFNLASTGIFYDVAGRDLVLACGAFALALLAEAVCACPAPKKTPPPSSM